MGVSYLLAQNTSVSSVDYREVANKAKPRDLVYMDPPYQGTSFTRDHRYFNGLTYDDFVEALVLLDEKAENTLVNIGAGEEHSIREFAKMICSKVGYDFSKIKFDTSKYVGAKSKFLDAAKMRRLLPETKMTSLEDGLEKTIEWFRKNKDSVLPK